LIGSSAEFKTKTFGIKWFLSSPLDESFGESEFDFLWKQFFIRLYLLQRGRTLNYPCFIPLKTR
jgi:hypothetical protein